MAEHQPPKPETMDTYILGDRSLAEWHKWLITDRETGDDTGHLSTAGSRYGATSGEAAYWAIALQVVYMHANGQDDSIEDGMESSMGLVVNDHPDVAELVRGYLWVVPDDLQEQLDWEQVGYEG